MERVTFPNPENGYSVLQATIKGYREEQTLVGTFHEVTVGAVLRVEGTWRVDKRYGRQLAKHLQAIVFQTILASLDKTQTSFALLSLKPARIPLYEAERLDLCRRQVSCECKGRGRGDYNKRQIMQGLNCQIILQFDR